MSSPPPQPELIDLRRSLARPRGEFLSEGYLVLVLTAADGVTVDAVLGSHGADIAQLLRGEREPQSPAEQEEVLRHRLSYFASDLVVPT